MKYFLAFLLSFVLAVNPALSASLTTNEVQLSDPNTGSVLYSDGTQITHNNQNLYWDAVNAILHVFSGLGSEKVTNGTFTGSAAGWTTSSGWTYSSNAISHSSNGTGALSQNFNSVIGENYYLSFDVSAMTAGTVTPTIGGVVQTAISANGTYTYRVTATSTGNLVFSPSNTARFTLDNITIKKFQNGGVYTDSLGIGGGNPSPTTTKMYTSGFSHSNGAPGTTRVWAINNQGSYSWIDFLFSGVAKSHIGANSSGGLSFYTSGGNYVDFYNKNTNSLYAYNYPTAFVHYGDGYYGGKVNAGATSTPHTTLQTQGGFASKVKHITANQTLDDTATKWLCDASSAACTGTPSTACTSHANSTTCAANDSHGGCTWNDGYSCSAYNGDQSSCEGQSGCAYETASCSGVGAYDQSSCESYGGCSWINNSGDCSGFDEETCNSTSGCSVNYDYCSNYSDGGFDGTACGGVSGNGCSYDFVTGSCSGDPGSWFTGCSGSYDSYSCDGSYYTGVCSGSYGSGCFGTPTCTGIDDSTSCGAETGCSYVTALTASLPPVSTVEGRDYIVVNDSSSNADCILAPASGDTVDGGSSYTLSNYKDWVHISAFRKTRSCTGYSEGTCNSSSGCSPAYANCTWDSMMSSCDGDSSCSGYSDQPSCEAATYYSYCTGTHIQTKNWYKFGN